MTIGDLLMHIIAVRDESKRQAKRHTTAGDDLGAVAQYGRYHLCRELIALVTAEPIEPREEDAE